MLMDEVIYVLATITLLEMMVMIGLGVSVSQITVRDRRQERLKPVHHIVWSRNVVTPHATLLVHFAWWSDGRVGGWRV